MTRIVWPERSTSAGICGIVVVSCLRQKGIGPSGCSERVLLLKKQNVKDAKNCMYRESARVVSLWGEVGEAEEDEGGDPTPVDKLRGHSIGWRVLEP